MVEGVKKCDNSTLVDDIMELPDGRCLVEQCTSVILLLLIINCFYSR